MTKRSTEGFFDQETIKKAITFLKEQDTGSSLLWAGYLQLFPRHRLAQIIAARELLVESYVRVGKGSKVVFTRNIPIEEGFVTRTFTVDGSQDAEVEGLITRTHKLARLSRRRGINYLDNIIPYDKV